MMTCFLRGFRIYYPKRNYIGVFRYVRCPERSAQALLGGTPGGQRLKRLRCEAKMLQELGVSKRMGPAMAYSIYGMEYMVYGV